MIYRIAYIWVRDCPYGICCPWVRGGWDLDALGKFFRRRRRRRRRRPRLRVPLLVRWILTKSYILFSQFSWKIAFGTFIFKKVVFWKWVFAEGTCLSRTRLSFLWKSWHLVISHENYLWGHLFLRRLFFKTEFPPKACAPVAKGFYFFKCSTFNNFFWKLAFLIKNWHVGSICI